MFKKTALVISSLAIGISGAFLHSASAHQPQTAHWNNISAWIPVSTTNMRQCAGRAAQFLQQYEIPGSLQQGSIKTMSIGASAKIDYSEPGTVTILCSPQGNQVFMYFINPMGFPRPVMNLRTDLDQALRNGGI